MTWSEFLWRFEKLDILPVSSSLDVTIAADFFALRKAFNGNKWVFSEGRNTSNPSSHCDIAWAGALATHIHTERKCLAGAAVVHETGWSDEHGFHPHDSGTTLPAEAALLWSDAPRIWH